MDRYQNLFKILIVLSICIWFSGCDSDPYNGFGCIAPEEHPAVADARSLSPEQLEKAYYELHALSDSHEDARYETEFFRAEIPESLKFLNAEAIRVYRTRTPYVILANCFDERIELSLTKIENPEASITLLWATPNNENPYAKGRQVLWRKNN